MYSSETYDYPTQVQESITQLSTTIGHGITNFAAQNLKGTNLPVPAPVANAPQQHKTLPHALGRAATTSAQVLQSVDGGQDDKLAKAMGACGCLGEGRVVGSSIIVYVASDCEYFRLF